MISVETQTTVPHAPCAIHELVGAHATIMKHSDKVSQAFSGNESRWFCVSCDIAHFFSFAYNRLRLRGAGPSRAKRLPAVVTLRLSVHHSSPYTKLRFSCGHGKYGRLASKLPSNEPPLGRVHATRSAPPPICHPISILPLHDSSCRACSRSQRFM